MCFYKIYLQIFLKWYFQVITLILKIFYEEKQYKQYKFINQNQNISFRELNLGLIFKKRFL